MVLGVLSVRTRLTVYHRLDTLFRSDSMSRFFYISHEKFFLWVSVEYLPIGMDSRFEKGCNPDSIPCWDVAGRACFRGAPAELLGL